MTANERGLIFGTGNHLMGEYLEHVCRLCQWYTRVIFQLLAFFAFIEFEVSCMIFVS